MRIFPALLASWDFGSPELFRTGQRFLIKVGLCLCMAMLTDCGVGDFKYIRKDLSLHLQPDRRIGVVVLMFAQLEPEDGKEMLESSQDSALVTLRSLGYEPRIIHTQLLMEGLRDSADSLPLFRQEAFGGTEKMPSILVIRNKAFWSTPGKTVGYSELRGTQKALFGGCWLDAYSSNGELRGVRVYDRQGWEDSGGGYVIQSPSAYARNSVSNLIRAEVLPYKGSMANPK